LVAESTGDAAGTSLLLLLQAIKAPVANNKRTNSFCMNFFYILSDATPEGSYFFRKKSRNGTPLKLKLSLN